MIDLLVKPEDEKVKVLDREVSKLQKDVGIAYPYVTGTLLYNENYTGFSNDPEEWEGHYLALKATKDVYDPTSAKSEEDYDVYFEVVNGKMKEPKKLDEDMNIVAKISDPLTQKIRFFSVDSGGDPKEDPIYGEKVLDLRELTLAPKSE